MGSKTDWLEPQILTWFFGKADPPTVPDIWYVALSTADYTETATGTALSEVDTAGTAYVRQAITNDTTNFPLEAGADPTEIHNSAVVVWPAATADWGEVRSVYLCDAETDGNAWFGANVSTPTTVPADGVARIPIGAFLFNED